MESWRETAVRRQIRIEYPLNCLYAECSIKDRILQYKIICAHSKNVTAQPFYGEVSTVIFYRFWLSAASFSCRCLISASFASRAAFCSEMIPVTTKILHKKKSFTKKCDMI